jgi:hypothetical protein
MRILAWLVTAGQKPLPGLMKFVSTPGPGRKRADIAKNARAAQLCTNGCPAPAATKETMRKYLKLLAVLSIWAGPAAIPAGATGNLDCTIDDANLSFELSANTGREHGTIVNLLGAELILKDAGLARLGREFKMAREHIIQQWFLLRELRIGINIDTDKGSLLLAITGQRSRSKPEQIEDRYSGRYVLTASFPDGSTRRVAGRIKGCSAG